MTNIHDGQTGIAEDSGFPDAQEGAYAAYFSTPARQGLIQQLLHLVRYGDGIPVVQGAGRSGKTSIAAELAIQLGEVAHLALVEVKSNARLLDVLTEVLRQYGFDMDETVSEGELLAELRRFSRALTNDKSLGVLILDNAHYLDDQSLGAVVSLLQGADSAGHGMHLVFFAQPDLVSRIDELGLLDVSVYDFDVPLFSPSELSDFLKSHLEFRADANRKLSAETVQAIWSRSRGAPGYSLRLMLESTRPDSSNSKPFLRNMPVGHTVALSVLGVVLVWALLLRNPGADSGRTASEVTLTNTLEKSGSILETASPSGFKATDFRSDKNEVAAANTISEIPLPKKDLGTLESTTEGAEMKEPADVIESDSVQGPAPELEQTPTAPIADTKLQDAPAGVTAPLPTPTLVPSPVVANSHFTGDEMFLLNQKPTSFTLQVMAASKHEPLEDFINKQDNRDSLFLYQGRRAGKAWFIVTAGIYPNRETAAAAIADLPPEQKKGGPWPRQLQNIQGEIREIRNK